jgi:hypothetical protein
MHGLPLCVKQCNGFDTPYDFRFSRRHKQSIKPMPQQSSLVGVPYAAPPGHGSYPHYTHAYLQLIRISEASEVQIHVNDFAAASFVATA